MRHGKKINHLGRKTPHRKAMLANMACSLIKHKQIKTTVAKAKALRVYAEPLITKAKTNTTHNRRTVFSYLKDKEAIKELFGDVASKVADRPGGYLRILKIGNRLGDNAEMAMVELVDYNEFFDGFGSKKPKKKRTRRKSKSATADKTEDTTDNVEAKTEEVAAKVEDKVEEVKKEDTSEKSE